MKTFLQKKLLTLLLVTGIALAQGTCRVQAASYRQTDVKAPSKGNVLAGVSGNYEYVAKDTLLNRINEIRKEACQKGYKNPADGKKLTAEDYVPIKWSSDLEWIAQIRAAESTVRESHTRPNNLSCFSLKHNGVQSWAENLAWNSTGLMQGIEQWYAEKDDWVKQTPGKVTGHYTSMINPSYQYIGLASFRRSSGGWHGVSGEFGFSSKDSGAKSSLKGATTQALEISSKYIGSVKLKAPSTLKKGKSKKLSVTAKITFPGIMGGKNITNCVILKNIRWSCSKKSVISVNNSGTIRAKKTGKAVISAKIDGLKTAKTTVTAKK